MSDSFVSPVSKLRDSGIGVAAAPTGGMGLALDSTGKLSGALLKDGTIPFAALEASAFTAYTPIWTATTTNPTLNDGTLTGRYLQLGKLVICHIDLTMGASTAFGTGTYVFSLPVTSTVSLRSGTAWAVDASAAATYMGFTAYQSATTIIGVTPAAPGSGFTPTVPFTWASGDTLHLEYVYEAA